MYASIVSATPIGIDAVIVTAEVEIHQGLPGATIVGLADAATRESKERVLAAIRSSGYSLPRKKVVVNLAPADVRKVGSSLDLPIAIAVLAAIGGLALSDGRGRLVLGELSLGGRLRPVSGVLPMVDAARRAGFEEVLVPLGNEAEAALIEGMRVIGIGDLRQAVGHLSGARIVPPTAASETAAAPDSVEDFRDVRGQLLARRALEIAAAGGHNVLMVGPPGAGKSMVAKRLPGILPPLSFDEAIEVTKIHSVAGLLGPGHGIVRERPFRAPHHTISRGGLIGGGSRVRPGDVSLAHRGVLFLDEFSEFPRAILELLRQPIEDRSVLISRAEATARYPASFMLVASMNPCPCGYYGDSTSSCVCTERQIARHWRRLSGPLLDRMDMVVEMSAVPAEVLVSHREGEASQAIRARVDGARRLACRRFGPEGFATNAEIPASALDRLVPLSDGAARLLERSLSRLALSARSFHRILKVSRTIADLDQADTVSVRHLREALQLRFPDTGSSPRRAVGSLNDAVTKRPVAG